MNSTSELRECRRQHGRAPRANHRAVTAVVEHVLRTGKDAMPFPVASLARRTRTAARDDPLSTAVLDCVLDKAEARYDYRSYLALDVLGPLLPAADRCRAADRLVPALIADLTAFEVSTSGADPRLPAGRPSADNLRRRIGKARRLVDTLEGKYGTVADWPADAASRLAFSVLPVSPMHDEYLFIRVLQAYEATFMAMALFLEQALAGARADDAVAVALAITEAADRLNDVGGLFSLLATMPPEHFAEFRPRTSGASAIQSASYKTIELLCAVPPPDRVESLAFSVLPDLKARALAEPDTVTSWYLDRAPSLGSRERETVTTALRALEEAHQKWKRTHYSVSVRMIGTAAGTGGTTGIGYLRACQDNRLFAPVGARYPELAHHRTPAVPAGKD